MKNATSTKTVKTANATKDVKDVKTANANATKDANVKDAQNVTEREPRRIKTNAERYANWKYSQTSRTSEEETEEKPRRIHLERQKRESDTYYFIRELTFKLTGMEYRTPQKNLELIRQTLNAKLPKENAITRFSFVVRGFDNIRFFPSNLEKDSFIGTNAHQPIDPDSFVRSFGLKPFGINHAN